MRRFIKVLVGAIVVLAVVVMAVAVGLNYWFFGGNYQPVGLQNLQLTPDREEDANDQLWKACLAALEQAMASLNKRDEVQVRFYKQERVNDKLGAVTVMETRQRRQPLSIYLRWVKPFTDREVIYQEGLREGRMICHEGGALLNLLPTVLLKPDGKMAANFSQHPLPDLCIWKLNEQALEQMRRAYASKKASLVRQSAQVRNRPCVLYEVKFPAEHQQVLGLARLVIAIDKELALPLRWEQYLPPSADVPGEMRLLEYIEFELPDFQPGLTDADFDPANKAYKYNLSRVIRPES